MRKYQFYISFDDKENTAASKAVQDCKSVLSELGYEDRSIEDLELSDKRYLPKLFMGVVKFFFAIKARSIVVIQYPLLSGNAQFKYFMMAARLKKVKFLCLVHDINELRFNRAKRARSLKEANILNRYDCIIVHNEKMEKWLSTRKVTVPMIRLKAFDYLTIKENLSSYQVACEEDIRTIVFAGNLIKSKFIYALDQVSSWRFNLYGPHFVPLQNHAFDNVCWNGSLGPDEILTNLKGAFGLIWDGDHIGYLDETNGHYLRYNNPHKLSLYLAAGLPVIAPADSAIAGFISENKIGILVRSLKDLNLLNVDSEQYNIWKTNVLKISSRIKTGHFMSNAVAEAEFFLWTLK